MLNLPRKNKPSEKECLELLRKNLSLESLQILAEKSKKKGINEKIQQYKYLI